MNILIRNNVEKDDPRKVMYHIISTNSDKLEKYVTEEFNEKKKGTERIFKTN